MANMFERFRRNSSIGKCEHTRELLSLYIDERLEARERQAVADHLSECEDCRQDLESLQSTVALLHLTPVVSPPRSFAIREEAAPRRLWQGVAVVAVLRWSTAVAAVLLLLMVGGETFFTAAPKESAMSASPKVQQATADRLEATSGEASRSAAQPPVALPTRDNQAPSDSASKAVAPSAQTAPVPAGNPAPGGADPPPTAIPVQAQREAGPTSVQLQQPFVTGLTPIRIAEIGLAGIVLVLAVVGMLARRRRY